ncbi:hypothetical protein HYW42_02750 [Candidatus Daviesbacteria bacterium]|nr:hypothetical protein [Candidatus Daviesbacteria bacterium]
MQSLILYLALALAVYKGAKIFNNERNFQFFSVISILLSPVLIYFVKLSQIPSTLILSIAVIATIILMNAKVHYSAVFALIVISYLYYPLSPLIFIPLILISLVFFQGKDSLKSKFVFLGIVLLVSIASLIVYYQRDSNGFKNLFSIYNHIGIINGVNASRGMGIENGWPLFLEKIFFNQSWYIVSGFFTWLSNISIYKFFGLDYTYSKDFLENLTLFPRVFIIPFLLGLVSIIRSNIKKSWLLPIFSFIPLLPFMFVYPSIPKLSYLPSLPFIAFIVSFGFISLNKYLRILILFFAFLEALITLIYV